MGSIPQRHGGKGNGTAFPSSTARGPAALWDGSAGRSTQMSWTKEIFHAGDLWFPLLSELKVRCTEGAQIAQIARAQQVAPYWQFILIYPLLFCWKLWRCGGGHLVASHGPLQMESSSAGDLCLSSYMSHCSLLAETPISFEECETIFQIPSSLGKEGSVVPRCF